MVQFRLTLELWKRGKKASAWTAEQHPHLLQRHVAGIECIYSISAVSLLSLCMLLRNHAYKQALRLTYLW